MVTGNETKLCSNTGRKQFLHAADHRLSYNHFRGHQLLVKTKTRCQISFPQIWFLAFSELISKHSVQVLRWGGVIMMDSWGYSCDREDQLSQCSGLLQVSPPSICQQVEHTALKCFTIYGKTPFFSNSQQYEIILSPHDLLQVVQSGEAMVTVSSQRSSQVCSAGPSDEKIDQ